MDKRTVPAHQRMEIPLKPNHALPYPSKNRARKIKAADQSSSPH